MLSKYSKTGPTLKNFFKVASRGMMSQPSIELPKTKMFINNEFVDSLSGQTFPTVDPRTEKVITEVPNADANDVDRAVQAARAAFDKGSWTRMSARERGRLMYKLADKIEENMEHLSMLESWDNGKPIFWSRNADIPLVISHFRHYAGWADKLHGKVVQPDGKYHSYTYHEPIGVAGAIIPWNFPLLMLAWKAAPALAAGCTVVVKVSEKTPLTALKFAELAREVGFPEGVINIVTGFGDTAGHPLVIHPQVDKISFTGSTQVGHNIMEEVAKHTLKPVTLELGGKSAAIVCEDADIDLAVEQSHFALFFNQGQCCCAGSRLFVHDKIYDEFVEKAVKRAKVRTVGDSFDDVEQGPQVDNLQFDRIMGYIEKGKQEGANLLTGGARLGDNGYFIEPTVFDNVSDDMTIAQEEIFGPVLSILKYSDYNEALERANSNPYGLGAGVWTSSIDKAMFFERGLRAGNVWVNCYDVFDAAIPFGGYKESGIGRDNGGEYAIRNYQQVKAVTYPLTMDVAWR